MSMYGESFLAVLGPILIWGLGHLVALSRRLKREIRDRDRDGFERSVQQRMDRARACREGWKH